MLVEVLVGARRALVVTKVFFFARFTLMCVKVRFRTYLASVLVEVLFGALLALVVIQMSLRTWRTSVVRQMLSVTRGWACGWRWCAWGRRCKSLDVKVTLGEALGVAWSHYLGRLHVVR